MPWFCPPKSVILINFAKGVVQMDYTVTVNRDEIAGVWCAVCDSIPLALESHSFDALIARTKIAAPEILTLNGKNGENVRLCFVTAHWEQVA
jgi:hypothetical protein